MVHSDLSWFSLTCHGAGPVQLVMVQSNLSWYSLTCHGAVQLVMVQFNLSWCSLTCHDNPKIWWGSNKLCSWPHPPPHHFRSGGDCCIIINISFLLMLLSPKRIEQLSSTWAHFKEQTQLFKMSPNWAKLLNLLRRYELSKLPSFYGKG